MQGMELEAAKVAVDSAKDTQLITLNKLLTPPELGSGSRSGSDSDDAEAHLQPYALEHDAAGPAPGQQSGPAQGKSKAHAPSAATLASEPTTELRRRNSKASGSGQQQPESGSAANSTGTQEQMQPPTRHNAAVAKQDSAAPAHAAGASSASVPSTQQQQDRPGPSAPDEQDIRAAEAVLRSTMLPTQVNSAQAPTLQQSAHSCVISLKRQHSIKFQCLTQKSGLQAIEQHEVRTQEEYMHGPDIFPRALIKRRTAGMLEIPDGKTSKLSKKEQAE